MLTSKDIKNKSFDKGPGYRAESVDAFMKQLANELTQIEQDREDANDKIQLLADKVREYRRDEDALKDALFVAQKESRRIQTEAEKKGEAIIRDAQKQADEILKNAQAEAQTLIDETTKNHSTNIERCRQEVDLEKEKLAYVQNQIIEFKRSLIEMYGNHIQLITQIPEDFNLVEKESAPEAKDTEEAELPFEKQDQE